MKKKDLLFIFAFLSIVGWGPFSFFSSAFLTKDAPIGSKQWLDTETKKINAKASNLDPAVLKVGLTAYENAREKGLDNKQLLTIIDYSKPSGKRRLWVVDMKTDKVLFNTWVAHGKNSGEANATSFSNDPSSLKSSIGVFLTSDIYDGKHGRSLRIQGLERGVNDNAYRRDIVFHGAPYAGKDVAKERGMLGRSWGCMAVGQDTIQPLISTIKDKTLVVAYYPDKNWLKHSSFLT
ncbi:MAG: hypothetical protein ACD_60C00149G0019 [uncultured bacterium]|nr:MAG: hypothetical protein ACD_60C00149G0019 [uncultured bacterium]